MSWLPRRPECAAQCPSCPFRQGNDKEFGEIMSKLRTRFGLSPKITRSQIAFARFTAMKDVRKAGDFACHLTAYSSDMQTMRCPSEQRQCPGATTLYREAQKKVSTV